MKSVKEKFVEGSLESIIECSRELYGDKYTFKDVLFPTSPSHITIVCPIHGEFDRSVSGFLGGRECPRCMKERPNPNDVRQSAASMSFVGKARAVHGDKYNYSKIEYVNSKAKVCIICPEHGEFWQAPSKHLSGRGCPHCAGVVKKTTSQFIEEARNVHGDKYDYSKSVYVNKDTKLTIICPEHGEFSMTPRNHLKSEGCPKCKMARIWETRRANGTDKWSKKQ